MKTVSEFSTNDPFSISSVIKGSPYFFGPGNNEGEVSLLEWVRQSTKKELGRLIDYRKKEFLALKKRSSQEWFFELCFCLLTANTSAELGVKVQERLGKEGLLDFSSVDELAGRLRSVGYRFYNRRAEFIGEAIKYRDNIKELLTPLDYQGRREWLVKNIKGLGLKEASHFLRNIGFFDYAIIDKHILRLMVDEGLLNDIPKTLSKKEYLSLESSLKKWSEKSGLPLGILDLYLWYHKTGKVIK